MSVNILIGDVRERLADIPPESVDCVVTSPPYWGLRDYGVAGQIGMEHTLGEHIETMVDVFRLVRRAMKPDASLWLNYGDCYATKPNGRSAAETRAHGTDDRTFRDKPFSTIGPVHAGGVAGGKLKPKDLCMVPNRIAIALQDDGWWVRSEIVWAKPNPMPDSSGRYRPSTAHEKIWLLAKSADFFYDSEAVRMSARGPSGKVNGWAADGEPHDNIGNSRARKDKQRGHSRRHAGFNDRWDRMTKAEQQANGRLLRNYEPDLSLLLERGLGQEWQAQIAVWEIATAGFSQAHFATFPPALVVPCIMGGCRPGGTVLDPFGGAGTTGLVADRLGRDAILIELNPEYAAMAEQRIKQDSSLFAEVACA